MTEESNRGLLDGIQQPVRRLYRSVLLNHRRLDTRLVQGLQPLALEMSFTTFPPTGHFLFSCLHEDKTSYKVSFIFILYKSI